MLSLRFKGHVNVIPTREWDSLFQGLSGTLSGKGFSAFILHLSPVSSHCVSLLSPGPPHPPLVTALCISVYLKLKDSDRIGPSG